MKLALIYPAAQFLIKSICLSLSIWQAQTDVFKAFDEKRFFDIVKYVQLININMIDKKGETLLFKACNFSDKNAPASSYRSVLHLIKLLVKKGADVNLSNHERLSPLQVECYKSWDKINFDVIKLLVEKGADVNKSSVNISTPLGRIIESHTIGRLDELRSCNSCTQGCYRYAEQCRIYDIMCCLIDNGANVYESYTYFSGLGSLHLCLHRKGKIFKHDLILNNTKVIKLLLKKDIIRRIDIELVELLIKNKVELSPYLDYVLEYQYLRGPANIINAERERRKKIQMGNSSHIYIECSDGIKNVYYAFNNQTNIPLEPIFSVRSPALLNLINK